MNASSHRQPLQVSQAPHSSQPLQPAPGTASRHALEGQAPGTTPASTPDTAPVATAADDAEHMPPASPSEQQALQALAEKGFIHDTAHQLRTPLAGIISQAELALQENDPQQLHQRIRKIHAAAQRGAQLVKQMLALARSEATEPSHIATEPYDIAQLAREVAREWIPKSLSLRKDLGYEGAESAWVRGNRFMMREAIGNLIDNALNYTAADGHITVRVQLVAAPQRAATSAAPAASTTASTASADQPTPGPDTIAILEVADNGPGVAPEQLPHVFERFWRADDEHTSGSGLGLPLVERIAAQHGGHASAHNAQPQGFVVRLHLPATAPDEGPSPATRPTPAA